MGEMRDIVPLSSSKLPPCLRAPSPGFEPGSPAYQAGMLTTTPRGLSNTWVAAGDYGMILRLSSHSRWLLYQMAVGDAVCLA